MNALRITETATRRRSAPTRLEALPVPVLTDILATGSPAQVTNERLFYILPVFVNFAAYKNSWDDILSPIRLVLVLWNAKYIIKLIQRWTRIGSIRGSGRVVSGRGSDLPLP